MSYSLNFKDMYTQATAFLQNPDSSGFETRIKDAINRAYMREVDMHDWLVLTEYDDAEITSVAGNKFIYLPKSVDVVKKILTDTPEILDNNNIELLFDRKFPILDTSSGKMINYSPVGTDAVKEIIASAETMSFVSSDNNDDTDINVTIAGLSGDDEVEETVAINGITPVVTTATFEKVSRIGVDGLRSGIITVSGGTSATVFATLGALEKKTRYQKLRVWPIPDSAETLTILYKKRIFPLVNDSDVCEVPMEEALIEFGIAAGLRQLNKWGPAREHERIGKDIIEKDLTKHLFQGENIMVSSPFGINVRKADTFTTRRFGTSF